MNTLAAPAGGWLLLAISVALAAVTLEAPVPTAPPLRVCADPNNLPFSNARGEGFENQLAELLARDLRVPVQYEWRAQRRGFLRHTLNAGRCDLVMGVPARMEMLATTAPYYQSTYVFVTRRAQHLRLRSLDDPQLHRLRIGVPIIGDDGANAPPAHALARRGIVENVVGYSVLGDYRTESPPSALVTAVARGGVDVATVWGPVAGYFAARAREPLDVQPIAPGRLTADLPIAFAISMGVRRGDTARLAMLNAFLARRQSEIDEVLAAFHVPRTDRPDHGGLP
jgi:mxaJ protein